jgi:hypothetical protein
MLDVSIRIGILNLMLALKEGDLAFLMSRTTLAALATSPTRCSSCTPGRSSAGPMEQVLQARSTPTRGSVGGSRPPRAARVAPVRRSHRAVDPVAGCRFVERRPLAISICPGAHLARRGPSHEARVT